MTTATSTGTRGTGRPPTRRRRRLWWGLAGGFAVVAIVAGAGLWWFLKDDAPPPVDLETAAEVAATAGTGPSEDGAADETPAATAGTDTATGGEQAGAGDAALDGIEGTWTVDTSIGTFDFESASGTFVGFRVEEELSSIGSTTAVGRTGTVDGSIEIDGTTLTAATVDAALSDITTNEGRRDGRVQSALETDRFPTATFVLTAPVELGPGAASGEPVAVTALGDLTIHGVTRSVEVALEAQLVEDVVAVVGSTDLLLSDYGVEAPSAPIVVSVSDTATVELQLLLTR